MKRALPALLGVAVLAAVWWPVRGTVIHGANDFLSFYAGARLAGTPELYGNPERVWQVQEEMAGMASGVLQFLRLPWVAAALWPLGLLPYTAAYAVFQALSLGALAAFLALWPKPRLTVALACAWSVPLSFVLAQAQDVTFLLLWVALAWRWHEKRPWAAGAVLALCSAKFHLFLLLPLLIVGQRRWRMGGGLLAGGAALAAVSFAVAGASWPATYAATLTDPRINPGETFMPTLRGLVAAWPHAVVWEVVLGLAALAAVWRAVRRGDFMAGMGAVLVGGLLVARHAYLADLALLIPALVGAQVRPRWLTIALLAPLWYLLAMAISPHNAGLPLGMLAVLCALNSGTGYAIPKKRTDGKLGIA